MVYGLLALLVVLLDQATKYYVVTHFALGESVPVINNVFHWTFILNRGAAFGMLEEITKMGVMACWGTALFAGGALGNLVDRTARGVVIDFFDFRIWPIFNVADIAICVGVSLIIWSILKTELLSSND